MSNFRQSYKDPLINYLAKMGPAHHGLAHFFQIAEEQIDQWFDIELKLIDVKDPKRQAKVDFFTMRYNNDLIPLVRYSLIVLLDSLVEKLLCEFCGALQKEKGILISFNELKGSPVERAKTYLTKLGKIKIGHLKQWDDLAKLHKIRNCVVHSYGFTDEVKLGAIENVTIDNDGRVILSKTFCDQSLENAKKLLYELARCLV